MLKFSDAIQKNVVMLMIHILLKNTDFEKHEI